MGDHPHESEAGGDALEEGARTLLYRGLVPLQKGTRLRQYVVQDVLGAGGFAITYRAKHETLSTKLYAIKEYFPSDLVVREAGLVRPVTTAVAEFESCRKRSLKEAEALSLCSHSAIVDVVDYFEENGTAYSVFSHVSGKPMGAWLAELKRAPTQAELDAIARPLLDALELVHGQKLLHRDIAPDNILIRPDGSPCLIDFGAVRALMWAQSRRTEAIVKRGFSPPEQYSGDAQEQGPWTDIYALGATLFRAVAGSDSPESIARLMGTEMKPLAELARGEYRAEFLAAIERALHLDWRARPQSVAEWRSQLLGKGREGGARQAATAAGPTRMFALPFDTSGLVDTLKDKVASMHWSWALAAGFLLVTGASWYVAHRLQSAGPASVIAGPSPAAPSGSASVRLGPSAAATTPAARPIAKDAETVAPAARLKPGPAGSIATPAPILTGGTATDSGSPIANEAALLRTAIQSDSAAASVLLARIWPECNGGEFKRVIIACTTLIEAQAVPGSDLFRVHYKLGRAFRETGEVDKAVAAYSQSIRHSPTGDAYNHRGIAYFEKGELNRAISDFGEAIRLDPGHGEALNNRAWTQLKAGRAELALSDADKAVNLLGTLAYTWDTRGHIHEQLGNRQEAIRDYRKSLAIDPASEASRVGLTRLGAAP